MSKLDQRKLAALRLALIEGERSGPPLPFDFELFLAEMRRDQALAHRVGIGSSPR
jgi:Arc/MetJ-type ribon-helix-helix transcriptional regulator